MIGPEVIAVAVFLFTYALIIDERIHRAVAAMFGASVIVYLRIVPWEKIPEYIDLGTIFLLIEMMIIVNTARGSALFEFIAIKTAKLANGNPMRMLLLFSLVTGVTSAFLDNVTTVLLLTPMLLYIASVMRITPLPFLIAEIFSPNIGGAATLIGDPPNIMIGSAAGLTFNEFIINPGPIMVVNLAVVMGMPVLIYRKDLHVSPDEQAGIEKTFANLNEREAIRDMSLFKKSVAVIVLVIGMFFVHDLLRLEPALVALIGASILLFWSRQPPEEIFEKIEWPALFFGGLFVVVGALVETGTIAAVAGFVVNNVHSEGEAMMIIAWFAAIASAIVDNIPLTATLIQDMGISMDTYPLWWALSLGACLGGNGTAIGASANVVVLGIAARSNLSISFLEFLKVGMLVLFVTVGTGTALLCLNFAVL